jgi:hypothetical protein
MDDIKELSDLKEEQTQRLSELEESKRTDDRHIKALENDLATATQDVHMLTNVGEEFKQKFDVLNEKESELNEKNKEYMLKIQELNCERDKCSLAEKKLQRAIDKMLDEHREELRNRTDRYEKMLRT